MMSKIAMCLVILLMYMVRSTDAIVRGEQVEQASLPFRALVSLQTQIWNTPAPNDTRYIWNDMNDHRFCHFDPATATGYPSGDIPQVGDWRHFCAGTLVRPRRGKYVVITSAGCVEAFVNDFDNLRVVIDTTDLLSPNLTCGIVQMIVHSKYYLHNRKKADVALLKVDESCVNAHHVHLNPTVARLRAEDSFDPADNTVCDFYGWGDLDCPGDHGEIKGQPRHLQKTQLKILNKELCEDMWKTLVNDSIIVQFKEICAIDMDEFSGACKGDSGGALVCDDEVVGIKTWGESEVVDTNAIEGFSKKCSGCKPNVFTRVSGYIRETNNKKIKLVGSNKQVPFTIP